jgi:hypothetical protein
MVHPGLAASRLRTALEQADAVFEPRLRKPEQLCVSCAYSKRGEPEVAAGEARFAATIREYRRRRLELPVDAVLVHSFGHGPAVVHASLRRFAWFVPSFLASSLEPGQLSPRLNALAELVDDARRAEASYRPSHPEDFTPAERSAVFAFLDELLCQQVAEPGFAPADAAAILRVARAFGLDVQPLVADWLAAPAPARSNLIAAVVTASSSGLERPHLSDAARAGILEALFTERVRAQLEAWFLAEQDAALAIELSRAEHCVRSHELGVVAR